MNNLASLVTSWRKYHHSPWDKRVLYSSSLQWNLWPRLSVPVGFAWVTFILQSPEGKMESQTCPSMVGIYPDLLRKPSGGKGVPASPGSHLLLISLLIALGAWDRLNAASQNNRFSHAPPHHFACTIAVLKLGLMTRLRDSDTWWLRQSTSGPLCLLASWYRQCPSLFESHDLIWHWVLVYTFPFGAQCLAHAKPWPQVQPMVMVILVPVIAMVTTVKDTLLWQWVNLAVAHLQFTFPYLTGLYQCKY